MSSREKPWVTASILIITDEIKKNIHHLISLDHSIMVTYV